jgi:hypothetical protein
MDTMLLAVDTWDLVQDASHNIALASAPYALAQDVASAIRTFLGEVWYDDTLGVPYLTQILGKTPPLSVFQSLMVAAAVTVPGVVAAICVIESVTARKVTGQVQFTDSSGATGIVSI